MNVFILIGLMLFQGPSAPQDQGAVDTLTLEYCYSQLEQEYPTADKIELQNRITELSRKIAATGNYPDITFNGLASYQSDVTEVTFTPPGTSGPEFSKDHYKISMEVNQPIYNGGLAKTRESLETVGGARERHSVEIQMHQLKEQLNEVYFGVLLLQHRLESAGVLITDLRQQLKTVSARVDKGVLLSSQALILRAELIKAQQDSIRLQAEKNSALDVLGILIDRRLERQTILQVPNPQPKAASTTEIPELRPEYRVFQSGRKFLDTRSSVYRARKIPALSAFATTAYGRPGLDVFNDNLQAYYIVGLRVRWNFLDALNASREQQIIRYEKNKIDADEEAFSRRLEGTLSNLREEIEALQQVVKKDGEIVSLSRKVVQENSSRLNKGVITSTEYLTELNRLHRARLNQTIHELELARARTDYLTKLGEPLK